MNSVLNIGGNNRDIPIPDRYLGWTHKILDLTPEADYSIDILDLVNNKEPLDLSYGKFDSVYMSHVIEHFHPYQIVPILSYIKNNLLVSTGDIYIKVPDIREAIKIYLNEHLTMVDPIYTLPNGKHIALLDMLYGWQDMVRKGVTSMQHKTAFDRPTLKAVVGMAGFHDIEWQSDHNYLELSIVAYAYPKC